MHINSTTLAILILLFSFATAESQESEFNGDPDIEAAAQAIRDRNTVVVEKTIEDFRVTYETRQPRCRLFRWRRRAIMFPKTKSVLRTVKEVRSNLDDGIGWGNIGAPELGFWPAKYPVKMLPASAGARGTKIDLCASAYLKDTNRVDVEYGTLDRLLVRTPVKIPGAVERELVRVEAKISGADDEATIEIQVQQIDAAGNSVTNKAFLNLRAKEIWIGIKKELDK